VERALAYIAGHLEAPMVVADIARAAGLSEFHLHRVFREALGETIGRFVTRRRLETAALRLAYETDRTISDIALSSGYSSSSNFTKAFSAYFGVSPSRVRAPVGMLPAAVERLTARHRAGFNPADLYTLPPERSEDERREIARAWRERVRFVDAPPRTFACLAGPGGYALGALMETWVELIERGRGLGLIPGEELEGRLATDAARGAGHEDATGFGEGVDLHVLDPGEPHRLVLLAGCESLLLSCEELLVCDRHRSRGVQS
jgi:AraC family transcriptional regulator